MGDTRFDRHLKGVKQAPDPRTAIHELDDEAIVQALAAAAREPKEPYLANILASEALNRLRRAHAVSHFSGDGAITVNHEGIVSFVNPAAEVLLATTKGSWSGRTLRDIVSVDPPGSATGVEEPLTLRAASSGVARIVRTDGSSFIAAYAIAPVVHEGETAGAVFTFRDETERRQSELALRRLAAIVNASTDAIYGTDERGRVTDWNSGAAHLYGYSEGEAIGMPLRRLEPPTRRGEERALLSRLSKGEGVRWLRTQRVRKDGATIEVILSAAPLFDASGAFTGSSDIAREVPHPSRSPARTSKDPPRVRSSAAEDDAERVLTLHRYHLLDTDPETETDDLARLAAEIAGTPIALVSLVDTERQWFKSCIGLDVRETPRNMSFCAHAILAPTDAFVIKDAREDQRFSDNPLVTGPPFIRFYAGFPIVTTSGAALGTLCVIDRVPRELSSTQMHSLQTLARHVTTLFELRRAVGDLADELEF